jgi:hypothetical protein
MERKTWNLELFISIEVKVALAKTVNALCQPLPRVA